MACISRIPRCGSSGGSGATPEPITQFGSILGISIGVIGGIVGLLSGGDKLLDIIATLGGAGAAGGIMGTLGALATLAVIVAYSNDRCIAGDGAPECVAGVVNNIVESFSDAWQELFPFTAMHDRTDIVTKSRFWDVVETSGAYVHCTDDSTPRRSEIMRCYFYSPEVCNAANGAIIGGAGGAVGGIILAIVVAAAIGCATIVFCFIALLLALLVAAACVLAGALIGGQIGKATSEESEPSYETGSAIAIGDLVSIKGDRSMRAYDDGAWVMWFSREVSPHGRVTADVISSPFSYCEIDDQLPMDSCPLPQPVIG